MVEPGSDIMNYTSGGGVMSGNFNCQIVFTEQKETVITGEDAVTTILEQLESAGIQVESQCRSGYCGACRLKKKSGEVIAGESVVLSLTK